MAKKTQQAAVETQPEAQGADAPAQAPKAKGCAITLEQFQKGAKALMVKIGDQPMAATVKEFSSGSFGWYANGKITIEVDGVPVPVQVGINLTVVGSKPKE